MNAITQVAPVLPSDEDDQSYRALLERVKAALSGATDIDLRWDDIRPYPNQPRTHFDDASITRLSEAIDAGGQITRGLVRKNEDVTPYELIDGERRWRAVGRIPEDRRPLYKAQIIDADDDVVQFLIAGMANFNREDHTTLEKVETIVRLKDRFKFPMTEIAKLLGFSVMWGYEMYGLKNLAPEVKLMLEPTRPKNQRLPSTAAVQISKIADTRIQIDLANRVLAKSLPLGALRTAVVTAGKKAGIPVRLRVITPGEQWESFGTRVDGLTKVMKDLQSRSVGNFGFLARNRPEELERRIASLDNAEKLVAFCKAQLIRHRL